MVKLAAFYQEFHQTQEEINLTWHPLSESLVGRADIPHSIGPAQLWYQNFIRSVQERKLVN